MKLVDLAGLTVEAATGAPVVVLQEREAPHRLLPIFVGGPEALAIAMALAGQVPSRPMAHDVMAELVRTLEASVDRVEVTELRAGAFLAELAITGPGGGRRVDSRPSDAIALAVRLGAPMFVSDDVLDEAGSPPEDDDDGGRVDDEAIDEEVARFRATLDALGPAAVGLDGPPEGLPQGGADGPSA